MDLDGWLSDLGYSKICDTKIFKAIEIYYLIRAFIVEIIDQEEIQHINVINILHIMETKFDILCNDFFNLEFTIHIFSKKS